MKFVSLFSGAGGFDLGLEAAGWECVAQVEWDLRCQSVLSRHWPTVPKFLDVSDVSATSLDVADAVAFGSPCQDLSVSGGREGFNGKKSSLFFEAIRIIREMRDATGGVYPRFAIWENVVGALSSSEGNDFAKVLDSLAEIGALDIAWRVLDAQYFGIAQRRRRVFVVADFGGECARAIHSEPHGVPCYPRTGRQERQKDSSYPEERPRDNSKQTVVSSIREGQNGGLYLMQGTSHTLLSSGGKMGQGRPTILIETNVMPTLTAARGGGPSGHNRDQHFVPYEDHVRRLTPLECERLNGWPDDHTRWAADGTEIAESHRYRMCGNGVAAPVAEWIAEQLGRTVKE